MSIIACVASNIAIATALALLAALVSRFTVRPQITHTLWLLVLVKLVTPPVVHIPVGVATWESLTAAAWTSSHTAARSGEAEFAYEPDSAADIAQALQVPEPARTPNKVAGERGRIAGTTVGTAVSVTQVLVGMWVAGSMIWFLVAGWRISRFRKILRHAHPACAEIRLEASAIASRYGLRDIPRILVAEAKVPPLIWSFGRRTVMVLPGRLLSMLGAEQRAGLLAP